MRKHTKVNAAGLDDFLTKPVIVGEIPEVKSVGELFPDIKDIG
jgi:hypothetical protein